MSKVFGAKIALIVVAYEFLNGESVELKAKALTTNEQKEINKKQYENYDETIELVKDKLRIVLSRNDSNLVERILNEQCEHGDLIDFATSLQEEISKVKEGK